MPVQLGAVPQAQRLRQAVIGDSDKQNATSSQDQVHACQRVADHLDGNVHTYLDLEVSG